MNSQTRRILPIIVTLALLMVGCRAGSKPLIEDQFQEPGDSWGERSGDGYSRGYASGGYFVEISKPEWTVWTTSSQKLAGSRAGIDIELVSGAGDGHAGIICRQEDAGAFYYLAISSDGYYGIFRRLDSGSLEAINRAGAMVHSPAIRTGHQLNHIEAVCEDDLLSLSVNGELLETVSDGALRKGRLGFGAGSGPGGAMRYRFDNLVVYAR